MSGYGGQSPGGQGWQDPYGQQQGWQDPYGQYGQHGQSGWQDPYTQPGYGQSGMPPAAPASNGSAIAALVCNIVAVTLCCNVVAIGGIVTAAIALGRTATDPESARRLTTWSWALLAIGFILAIGLLAVLVMLGEFGASSSAYD